MFAAAASPLHQRIDGLIAAKAGGPSAGPATDAEFLRRVFLDLTGRIPSVIEARAFLADKSPGKRNLLIDQLLSGPEYPRRMQQLFHVMLMERRGDHEEWTSFLLKSFAMNKPWDRMVREMLSPNAEDANTRGSAFFISKRLEKYGQNPVDLPGLTRDVGRMFLGLDLQCAQCHDHLHIDDYKQSMYQGLFAFVGTTYIRRDKKFPAVGEKPLKKKVDFMSVFLKTPLSTGPRVPGDTEIVVPKFKRGEEYSKPPVRKTKFPGELKFSPLRLLGERLPRKEIKAFSRNITNRLWWVMIGRGIVDPLDRHHSGNAPSHPKLLDLLAREFVEHKFDIKFLIRELVLTKTYQRSGLLPVGVKNVPAASYRTALQKPLSAEQLLQSMLQATGTANAPKSKADRDAFEKRFAALEKDFVTAFGNTPREPEVGFNPSVKAALFISNAPQALGLLNSKQGNLIDRLVKQRSVKSLADELYLSILTRKPTAAETKTIADHLQTHSSNRPKAVGQLVWALLTSTEFCLNQ